MGVSLGKPVCFPGQSYNGRGHMKPVRSSFVYILLVLLTGMALVSCGTGNTGTTAAPDRNVSDAFSVVQLDGRSTYDTTIDVQESGSTVLATIKATGAVDVESVAMHLEFDPSSFSVSDVVLGDFLGTADQTVSLVLTDRSGYVPIGIAQIGASDASPANGSGVIATVEFTREAADVIRRTSYVSPADTPKNAVDDLVIGSTEGGVAELHWTELNVGDYNNDGLVSVNDLTPVGQFYGQQVSESNDPDRVGLADGTRDGWIQVDDITPIGQNYDAQLSGYILYTDAAGTVPFGTGITALRTDAYEAADNKSHPIEYTYDATLPTGEVHFTVRPVCATDLANPGAVSNEAAIIDDGEPPEPPSNVVATSDATTGHKTVRITWDPSPSLDVQDYVVERQLDSEPGVWTLVNSVSAGGSNSLVDDDTSKVEAPYTYRVKAVDLSFESGYVNSNSITPYVIFLEPPANLTVDNGIATAYAIQLEWDAPSDLTGILAYRVYDADTDEVLTTTSSTSTTQWMHTGLTAGVTYNYYVVSLGGGGVESEPSNTAGTTPSTFVEEISIQSFTTSKTTHYYGATEAPATLTVTTDYSAESVDWDGGGGVITGTGNTVTWMPTMLMPAQVVTVTVTVHRGSASDTAELNLYVVTNQIKATYGVGNGHYVDFTAPCVVSIDEGGGTENRSFSDFCSTDNVVMFDYFESS